MIKYLIIILFLTFLIKGNSQNISLDFLFSPGLTYNADYMPLTKYNESLNFQLTNQNFQFTLPLKTKIGVDLKNFNFKEMDANASQVFLSAGFGLAQPQLDKDNYFENIYNGNLGLTGIFASARKGIWVYSSEINFSETSKTLSNNFSPNFRGFISKVKVKKLKTIYFYGVGLSVNQGKFYPVPLLGMKAKLSDKWNGTIVFPVKIYLRYKLNRNLKIDLGTSYDGLSTVFRQGSFLTNDENTLRLSRLKSGITLKTKLGSNFKLDISTGWTYYQKIYAVSNDFSQNISEIYYVSLSLNYHFGKSIFDNFMSGVE